jgi:hypothetical protein
MALHGQIKPESDRCGVKIIEETQSLGPNRRGCQR